MRFSRNGVSSRYRAPLDGKEGVDGSSPSEGFDLLPAQGQLLLSGRTRSRPFQRPPDVHERPPPGRVEGVE